jgi:3',5'-cyclic AMP phosphodiesterase CpdA
MVDGVIDQGAATRTMFRLAHVTDPHFRSFSGAQWGDFLGKRALGALNVALVRRRKHRMALLERLREDLRGRAVDHLALTGDLSNVSLESEWLEARRWLQAYGAPPEAVTVIPGNHDTYVPEVVRAGTFERVFGAFQTADLRAADAPYPFVRLRGEVALVAVNSCVPTGDLGAWGEIGRPQLESLEAQLADPQARARTRVVLIHHPPVLHRPPEHRNLRDREALRALLRRTGADLVLHGHDHRDERATLEGPSGVPIPVVGAGSASYEGRPDRRSRYNVYEIEHGRITALTYAHDEPSDRFVEVRRETLTSASE